ncbi:MAG: RDD family protein [Acidobacteriota bacterium]
MSARRPTRTVLTPEHVVISLTPAGLGSRFIALLVDQIIIIAASTAIYRVIDWLPFGIGTALAATLVFIITWGYHVYFEVRHHGRSPGKRMTHLRVVDGRGLPISLPQSLVRNLVRVLDFTPIFYGLGGIVCLLDPDRRRLGDIAADTLVVREAAAPERAEAIVGPRRHNSLASPALLKRIRRRITLDERAYLVDLCLRADDLDDDARYDLMEATAQRFRTRLGIDDHTLSGENLVRDLTAVLLSDAAKGTRAPTLAG